MTRHRLLPLLVAAGLTLAGLSGCGGDDDKSGGGDAEKTPEQALAAAKKTLDDTSGVAIELTTSDLPSGVSAGISSAEGVGVHPSAFEGTFKLSVSGIPADAEVIAVDGTTYAKNTLLLPQWTEIDPADYGAPDPTKLMDPDGGFSGLLSSAQDLKAGDTVRGGEDNKEILTEYTGTLPAEAVAALVPAAAGDFSVTYTITDDDELREAVIKGAFYGTDEGELTYSLTLDRYGTQKEITAP